MAFTYNDPVIFLEYAVDVARACREVGVKTVAVTAGYVAPEPRAEFFRHMDAANVDLKGFTEDFYRNVCGGHLDVVLETLVYLKNETSVWFELTNLLIPGVNDTDADAERLARLLKDIPAKVNLIPYNANPGLEFASPEDGRVDAFQAILIRRGLTAVIRKTRGRDISAACGQLAAEGGPGDPRRKHLRVVG